MKIVLLRHGKPDLPPLEKVKACDLQRWIDAYNAAGIDHRQTPPLRAMAIASECNAVVCSDLPRSIESAAVLNVKNVYLSNSVFNEVGMPRPDWNSFRLPPFTWAVIFRMLWFLGYSSNSESYDASRLRAKDCARKLKEIAADQGTVLFVGHGLINYFIAKELLAAGWHGPRCPGRRHWEYGVYTSKAE